MTSTTPEFWSFRQEKRLLCWLFLIAAAGLLLIQQGAITNSDGASTFAVTKALVTKGTVAVTANLGIVGHHGQHYSRYGIGLSLASIPAFLAGTLIQTVVGNGDDITGAAVASLMPLISAALILATYGLCRRLGGGVRASLLVSVGSVLGTYLLPYSKDFFSEPLAALFLVLSIERAIARKPFAAGSALALAALTRPQSLIFVPVLLWRLGSDNGWKGLYRGLVPVAIGGLAIAAYNFIRFDDIANFGYPDIGFTNPIRKGAFGLLFSPSKSVLLFAPAMLLIPLGLAHLWKHCRTGFWLIAGNFGTTFAITATWASWMGGWAWGPRLLIPAVPAALASLAPWAKTIRIRGVLLAALFGMGLIFSLPAVIAPTQSQQLDNPAPTIGPGIQRQYELIPEVTKNTLADIHHRRRGGGEHRRYLSLWQFAAWSLLGPVGLLFAVVGSALLVGNPS